MSHFHQWVIINETILRNDFPCLGSIIYVQADRSTSTLPEFSWKLEKSLGTRFFAHSQTFNRLNGEQNFKTLEIGPKCKINLKIVFVLAEWFEIANYLCLMPKIWFWHFSVFGPVERESQSRIWWVYHKVLLKEIQKIIDHWSYPDYQDRYFENEKRNDNDPFFLDPWRLFGPWIPVWESDWDYHQHLF